jgi:hypothetical protein
MGAALAPGGGLQIIYWIWGVGGLFVSVFLPIVGLGPIFIWIGGMILLGFGEIINQNQFERDAIWREQFARREQESQTAQP